MLHHVGCRHCDVSSAAMKCRRGFLTGHRAGGDAGGSFGGSDGESMGSEGTSRASNISNLLIMLNPIAGFDLAIRRFESFHPSQESVGASHSSH
jgi:hypothetical protein